MTNYGIQNLEEIICPHCGKTLGLNDIQIRNDDEIVFPETFSADISQDTHSVFVCPECTLKIPYTYLKRPCIFISFYGKERSGKSHILAMMTKQFGIYTTRKGNYTFRSIVDQEGTGHINALLQIYQNLLLPKANHQAIEPLRRTEADTEGAKNVPYDFVKGKKNEKVLYPKPFIYELKKNDSRIKKQEFPDSIEELISRPYNVRKRNALKKYDLRRGIYLALQDIKGEFCSPDGTVDDRYKIIWPVHTYGQIRVMVYNPKDSLNFVRYHNSRTNRDGRWEDELVSSDVHIGNETIWNIFRGDTRRADTLVLVSQFDECVDDFCSFLDKPEDEIQNLQNGTASLETPKVNKRRNGMQTPIPQNQSTSHVSFKRNTTDSERFRELFQSGMIPSMEEVRYFSNRLRDFLNLGIADTEFTSHADQNTLFVPISAMGCRVENGAFPKCMPIWTEVPMIWLLEVLERRAKKDAMWIK